MYTVTPGKMSFQDTLKKLYVHCENASVKMASVEQLHFGTFVNIFYPEEIIYKVKDT